ncbi:MAG: histidinol dehydrogenase, partial [Chloroflexi bacterium]
ARFTSPLNVTDFIQFTALVNLDDGDLQGLVPAAATIARAEGLLAPARAVERRISQGPKAP